MTKHKMIVNGFRGLVTTGLVSLLVACGGGGSSSDQDIVGTEVLTLGTIQRFGSVYVNDTRYVSSASGEVLIDDNPSANEDSLRIGMRVKLRGRYNDDGTGTYDSIEVDNELKGPIETGSIMPDPVDPTNPVGSFVVLGTKVLVGDGVLFRWGRPGRLDIVRVERFRLGQFGVDVILGFQGDDRRGRRGRRSARSGRLGNHGLQLS